METSPVTTEATENPAHAGTVKQAACLSCRRSKTRCLRDIGDTICKRCSQIGTECVIPDYRVGRKKGIKNKRDGLDKAVHRIEQALKKTKSSHSEDDESTFRLRSLLSEAHEILPRASMEEKQEPLRYQSASQAQIASQLPQRAHNTAHTNMSQHAHEDNYSVDDAENPLQLLARASDLSLPVQNNSSPIILPPLENINRDLDLETFFGQFRPTLDVGDDIDPIEMGLITLEEADMLFVYFFQSLSHTRWGLDPLLHTPQFVRKRSAFLFTSILAASALFLPSTAALSKRLSSHCKLLANQVIKNRNRSPEIVLGFMVNIPWMSPGNHWSDDETCSYMAQALTIAIDVYLNKCIVPSPSAGRRLPVEISQAEEISARKALDIDGFPDVDPSSTLGRRLLRRRERIWLSLFVLDRGVCLARGRNFTVPLTPLIEHCDQWHKSDMADGWDGSIISSAVLRRDLVKLISDVKKHCDNYREINVTADNLQLLIEGFFSRWYALWAFTIGGATGTSIPPYVEILVTHGRLSIYSSVINHPTAPIEVKRFFRAAALSSALNVMRAAVQGESRLKSMPNNTVIMISFAAMISFKLSTMDTTSNRSLAPSIRILIEETTDVLERIGTTPPHRKGISTLYGRHLRHVLNTSERSHAMAQVFAPNQEDLITQYHIPQQDQVSMHTMQFSAMSDDQIIQAISAAGEEMGTMVPSFQPDGRSGLDWLDWFNLDVNG